MHPSPCVSTTCRSPGRHEVPAHENVSYRVAGHLKAAGHEAVHVGEIGLTSTEDAVILSRARDEAWVLVTADHDFVQMLFASDDTTPSLILIREVQTLRSDELAALLLDALAAGLAELLPDGVIASLSPERVRVRPLPLRPDTPKEK
jgi:predicted nuclease of predicted toxin-antitoxin system